LKAGDETDRKALFDLLLAEEALAAEATDALIARADPKASAELSYAQQRLWFLDQFEPGGAAYNVPGALRLRGELDPAALRAAVEALGMRHDVFSTVFRAEGDQPVARVEADVRPHWTEEDLTARAPAQREAAAQQRLVEEAAATFDLQRGPLVRAVLIKVAPREHLLLITMHHIISDQWSLGLLAGELAGGYRAALGEGESPARPAVQYADYAAWQRRWRETAACAEQIEFWRGQLAGAASLELPTDFGRTGAPSVAGATVAFKVPAAALGRLEAVGKTAGATRFMALLAVFKVLLHRYTGQADLAVGSPVTGRSRPETAPLIGFFTNTLVLRTEVVGEPTFRQWLERVRETCLAAYAHQDVPFELLAEVLSPARELDRTPFFDVMFVHQTELPALNLPGVTAEFLPTEIPEAKFDLTLTVRDAADGSLEGWIEFRTSLYRPETIQRMAQHFVRLIGETGRRPDAALLELPMLNETERERVLHGFNATEQTFARTGEALLHRYIEGWAERAPDRLAVADRTERLTYAELDRRANQLAHRLRGLGVGPEVMVGLGLGRTVDMMVAVLGVMKAGGCYLPLDPGYPADRLVYMLKDSAAPVLITHAESREQFAAPAGVTVLDLDLTAAELAAQPATRVNSGVVGANLAYIIYTSGSTGKPKGTTLSHAAMCNLIDWHYATLRRGSRAVFFASLSFDVSFHDIFAVLGSGGELHIADEAVRADPSRLVELIERERIEKIILPVVVLQQIAADHGDAPRRLASLRELTTTGEALILTPAIAALARQLPACVFHNHYGPSETHVVTAYTFDGPPAQLSPPPPIGRPIANTQIYLLDARGQPVPVGVPGELFIGGANLGRDYHRRPELTAERFVPNPFAANPGERLYRTGDRARWLPDGNIEFYGRLDDQVKIRGFRVELGEVETHLVQHPAVTGAAVARRERPSGDPCLAAFFTTGPGVAVSGAELRTFLADRLPDYMVPAVYVPLPTLPLTPSGKVNRRGLPALEADAFTRTGPATPPADEAEQFVAEIWSELLGVPTIGRDDQFFHLGGHSLLATRVIARIRQRTTLEVPLRELFERPTLAEFTAALADVAGSRETLATIVATVREIEALPPD